MRTLRPGDARALLGDLRDTRAALLEMKATEIASLLGTVGARFLNPGDPLRREALERMPDEAGFSLAMAERVLDGMARDWTEPRLARLLEEEFGEPAVLDTFHPLEWQASGARLMAVGDPVAVHIGSGSVPGVCATSMIRSLLVKTPLLVKPGAGDRALTELFLDGLEHHAPELAAAVVVAYWPSGEWELEEAVLEGAGRVVVYGSDETARLVRDRVPVHVPLVVYHHRTSVAILGEGAVTPEALPVAARDLAFAASTFDQRGCVSPHRAWVLGTPAAAEQVAYAVAEAMARESQETPPGPRPEGAQARVHQLRASVELRSAAGEGVCVWGDQGTRWTVVLEGPGRVEPAGTPRTLVVTSAADLASLAAVLEQESPHLQSVGLAGLGDAEEPVVKLMARLGATRMVRLRDMPFPPAWWHHDGQGPLRALVRWVEWTR
jgi:hypothetical protein